MAEDVSTAAGVGERLSHAGSAGQTGIVDRLHGLHALATEVVRLVRQTVSTTVQATGSVARETGTVVRDMSKRPLQATAGMRTGFMTRTKPLTHGVVLEGVRWGVRRAPWCFERSKVRSPVWRSVGRTLPP